MADRITGITVEIGGDVTGLSKALSGVNQEINATQRELRDVERLLKLDPTNTELLAQKQRLLSQTVEETEKKYTALRQAEGQLQQQLKSGKLGQKEYDAFNRELEETRLRLNDAKEAASEFQSTAARISSVTGDLSEGAGKLSQTFAPVTRAVAGLATAVTATIPATEELRTGLSQLDTAAAENKVSAEAVRDAWEDFVVASGEVDSSVEATANLLQAGFTESNLQKAMEGLTGAYLRFPDTLKIESLADSLQETLATGEATGQFAELLDRLGVGTELFNRELAEAGSQAERQNVVLRTLAREGLDDTYRAWLENNEAMVENRSANLELQQSMAALAEAAMPLVTRVTELLAGLVGWFAELDPGLQGLLVTGAGILALISPIAAGISTVSGLISTLTGGSLPKLLSSLSSLGGKVLPAISGALSGLLGLVAAHPFLAGFTVTAVAILAFEDQIKAVLEGLSAFFTDTILPAWDAFFGKVSALAAAFGEKISDVFDGVRDLFTGIIEFIRTNFVEKWQLAWETVVDVFQAVIDTIADIIKAPINAVLAAINFVIGGINALIDVLNAFSVEIPDWVPLIGGETFGFDLGKIEEIPYLARGGVVRSGSAIVGEAGPELLTVAGGRAIVQPLGSSGGRSITQTNYFTGYQPRDGARAVRDLNRQLGWLY